MHIHILGVGGTFMAGIATLAKAKGHKVTGSDNKIYPPMSDILDELGIKVAEGYDVSVFDDLPDLVVIGNALSRGNLAVEYVLSNRIPYISGPEWLKNNILRDRFVIAVAGTHGKTTVSSLVAWLFESAGLKPGFLIGGVPGNFDVSARLGQSDYFIIEADEYDTAFFDKRSKFIHYQPNILIINNLEYDHADIFDSLQDITKQFHHLIRTMSAEAVIIFPSEHTEIDKLIKLGCWSKTETFGSKQSDSWVINVEELSEQKIAITDRDGRMFKIPTPLLGLDNAWNVAAAFGALSLVTKNLQPVINQLPLFANASRRLQLIGIPNSIRVYDDFAHHPSAIASSLTAIKKYVKTRKLIAVLELRSNTMVMGVHKSTLAPALESADLILVLKPNNLTWDLADALKTLLDVVISEKSEVIVQKVAEVAEKGDSVIVMSNGASENLPNRIVRQIEVVETI
ncbi:MAG: UDP-N-acetylmuramate:L-alanyl-gamma-D-glutamyl-meso-diaminopimelate ligase [Gammaproteobacteria bacterium]